MTARGDEVDGKAPQETEYVFRLPDLGEGLLAGEIVDWLVEVGDQVEVDQPVVVIETAKTTTELPIPCLGRVAQLHGAVQDMVEVGAPLLTVQVSGGQDRPASPAAHLVGHLPAADTGPGRDGQGGLRRLPPKPGQDRVVASPAVRRLARELNVELRGISGTGNGGAITRDDVQAASQRPARGADVP